MEEDLQHAHRFAGDLRPRHALEEGLADLVGHLFLGQLALGLAQRTDLGNGVDAGGDVVDHPPVVVVQDIVRGRTPLVVGGTGQTRPADDVARRIDVGDRGPVVLVDGDLAPAVDRDAHVLQAQLVGVAGPAVTPQQGIGAQLLAGLQVQDDAVFLAFDALVFLVVTNEHIVVLQVIAQGVGDLVVEEAEQLVAVVDQVHQHAETTEDGGVFAADHPGTIYDQPARGMGQRQDGVAVVDARMAEVHVHRAIGSRAGSDDDLLGHQALQVATQVDDLDGVLVGEAGGAKEQVDAIARVVAGAGRHLAGDHPLGAAQHVGKGEPARLADGAEHLVGVELDDLLDRMAQRLGGNGAQVGAVAADHLAIVHHRHATAILGGVHRRALACRSRTQYHHVVAIDRHAFSSEG